ncbi:unnamed protein product, partial [Laminaria digitata]
VQFRVGVVDLPVLEKLYEEHVWRVMSELDEAARDDPNAVSMGATICWAPMDLTLDT